MILEIIFPLKHSLLQLPSLVSASFQRDKTQVLMVSFNIICGETGDGLFAVPGRLFHLTNLLQLTFCGSYWNVLPCFFFLESKEKAQKPGQPIFVMLRLCCCP